MEEIEVHSNVILEYQHRAGPNQIWGSDQEIYKTIEMYDSAISFWKAWTITVMKNLNHNIRLMWIFKIIIVFQSEMDQQIEEIQVKI